MVVKQASDERDTMAAAGRQAIDWASLRDYEEHTLTTSPLTSVQFQSRVHNQARYYGERVVTNTLGRDMIRFQFFPAEDAITT